MRFCETLFCTLGTEHERRFTEKYIASFYLLWLIATMPAEKHACLIGRTAELSMEKMFVFVTISAYKEHFGRTDVLVSPVAGRCSQWVRLKSLTVFPK